MHDLWDVNGKTGRARYALWGALLVAVKYNIDRFLAAAFGHPWLPFSYLVERHGDLLHARFDWNFLAVMVAVSLPFIWAGVCLTVRRLKDVGWPLGLVALFFVPVVNYVFFLVLALTPGRESLEARHARTLLARIIPDHALGAAAVSLAASVPLGIGATVLATVAFKNYGWGVFIGLPFWVGMVAVLVYGYRSPRSIGACIGVATLAITIVGCALVAIAVEGVICVLMAAPLALGLAILGAIVGYFIQKRNWGSPASPPPLEVFGALLLAMPGILFAEHARPWVNGETQPPLLSVTSVVEIDAPPAVVWEHVVSFQQLDPPTEWYFQTGLAYPVRAEITGTGVGAVRHCVFSTGAFVEPIEVWEPGHRLGFGVTAEPPAMKELSPYPDVKPPHLDHYFSSKHGEFLLTELPGGRTRLAGTTWYRNRFWPQSYWQLWSDTIIHGIHMRVLEHVKRRSEVAAHQ